MGRETKTGGREATEGVITSRFLSVGKPRTEAPDGFEWTPLTSVARLETGHTPARKHPEYWDGDIPWIGIRDATANHGRTISSTRERVTQAGVDNSSTRLLPADTVCLSRTASVGYVVTMGVPMCTSQDFVNWVCGPLLNHRYLNYVLVGEHDAMLRFAHGSTHQTIYFPEVKAFHASLPDRKTQDSIAGVLGALDDKIASNRQSARVADEIADIRFAQVVHDQPTQQTVQALSEKHLLRVSDGYRTRADQLGSSGMRILRVADFDGGHFSVGAGPDRITDAFREKYAGKCSSPGDVVITTKGTVGRVALVRDADPRVVYSPQLCFLRSLDPAKLRPSVLHRWVRSRQFAEQARRVQDQTDMAAYVSLRDLAQFQVPLVDGGGWLEEIEELDAIVDERRREASTLAALRDALLPELLSGRLRVPEAEELVSDAT